MALVNQLRNQDATTKVLAVAAGRHVVQGQLAWTYTEGTSPTHQLVLRQLLGKGVWQGVEGLWYRGLNVPAADYIFSDGTQTAPTAFFLMDKEAHTGTVLLDVKAPVGVGEPDTSATTPDLANGIFKTEKFPDFDEDGNQVDPADGVTIITDYADLLAGDPLDEDYFTYTANPARVCIGWMLKYGNIAYSRINWTKWAAWRDYCAATETVDWRTIAGFKGFGLTARYYNGVNFDTFVVQRVDNAIDFPSSTGAPSVGVNVNNFSVRYEGFIKPPATGNYIFRMTHDDGVRLWVDDLVTPIIDQWTLSGSLTHDSGTVALTADTFYPVKIEWFDQDIPDPNPAQLTMSWQLPGTVPFIPLKAEELYPKVESLPRYESHVAFSTPTTLDEMIDTILRVTNSIKQDVDGLIEFYCVEQLSPSFDFEEDLPEEERQIMLGSLSFSRTDIRISELQNVWEARFRDLDSQYLEEPLEPVTIEIPEFIAIAGRKIYGEPLFLHNTNRWQALKVLQYFVDRFQKDLTVNFDATGRCYEPIAGDLVNLTHSAGDFEAKEFQVVEALDASPEETSDTRKFILKEY